MVNQLASESSPYLQQHKDNPVNWYPWGEEAFKMAKKKDKPLFISIGYSACHWCHVMARESFEDDEISELMNEYFVNIKVDREEYPDVDKVYQRYYNSLTGEGGGWPLSVWAFPDGLPFFIGTYFPKSFNLRTKTFKSIIKEIAESWEKERDELLEVAISLSRNLNASNKVILSKQKSLSEYVYKNELKRLQDRFDYTNGGLDSDPKFPRYSTLRFLLHESSRKNLVNLKKFVEFTFHQMTKGGIYDQLGGGIARYAVDEKWLIPHFEKMLYDNAGLLKLSADLFAITGDPHIEYIVRDTISFLVRVMLDKSGAFYSSIDAESEGVEGKYYVWYHSEIKRLLDPSYWGLDLNLGVIRISIDKPEFLLNKEYKIAKSRYGVSRWGNFSDPHGNLRNSNILSIKSSISLISNNFNTSKSRIIDIINKIKSKLFEARKQRIPPAKDKKIITAWNSMLVTSLFQISSKVNLNDAIDLAIPTLEFILNKLFIDPILYRTIHAEDLVNEPEIEGVLDDYAYTIEALITAYEHIGDNYYLDQALRLQELADEKFYDKKDKIYYYNQDDQSIGRIISAMDDSFSSAIGVMVKNLFKLGAYQTRDDLKEKGKQMVERLVGAIEQYEGSMNELLISASFYLQDPIEIVLVKQNDRSFDQEIFSSFIPTLLIYRWKEGDPKDTWDILENRLDVKQPTVYICKGNTCSLPITSIEDLRNELKKISSTIIK